MKQTSLLKNVYRPLLSKIGLVLLLLLLTISSSVSAQMGGIFTYEFLNFAPSARVSALAGAHIAVVDEDVNLAAGNPALLNPKMHEQLSFSHAFHPAGIHYGYVAGGYHHKKLGVTFHGGIRYVNYGDFNLTNDLGQVEGDFKAKEQSINFGAGYSFAERFTLGVNAKLVTSSLESYNSVGLLGDIGLLYQDTASLFTFTILAKNAGVQLSHYREDNKEDLPFEMQMGVSKRLQHLPLRFSVIYRYLDRWDVLYDDPNQTEDVLFLDDNPDDRSSTSIWFDNLARHFVFNAELYMGKRGNFRLRLGYSHLLKKELSVGELRSLAGFAFGAGLKINRFHIDYGRTTMHIGGGINQLSIATNIQEFK